MGIKVESDILKWSSKAVDAMGIAYDRMAKDIVRLAKIKVPYKSGDLMKETKSKKLGLLKYRVTVDKEYASYQERGKRKNGTHVVRKYTTPNTGRNFLSGSADSVVAKHIQYLKQANQLIRL